MKRILSLDGGGIRGVFSLQILKRIEEIFREERGEPKLVLRDVFDFFAGTSTGAIIATYLAWGKSVAEIEKLYCEHAKEMFSPAPLLQRHRALLNADPITRFFMEEFREKTGEHAQLGTRRFYANEKDKLPRTYLLVVMHDASTGSPWPLNNNPLAKYNQLTHAECNLKIPLWKLLRASTAAPIYFLPESIPLGEGAEKTSGIFMDGGITPYNNPGLIAALMATLPSYKMDWKSGPDQLQLISVGASQTRTRLEKHDAGKVNVVAQVKHAVKSLLYSVGLNQDMLCRVLGHCVHGEKLDSEIGELLGNTVPLAYSEKKFTYARYNQIFTQEEVRAMKEPFALDNVKLVPHMQKAGQAYAKEQVKRGHFFPEKA
jgi:hypothetical protein